MTTLSGTFVSSLKDANPRMSVITSWTTLTWNATLPANTTLQFQVAGSNNPSGPFNFVGPDTTAATFFTTSGGSLSQFNGMRYLKYKAYLSTTDPSLANPLSPEVSSVVNDVTVGYALAPSAANVSIGGRLVTQDGRGIGRAIVSLTNSLGVSRTATTSAFGYFSFEGVEAGESYVLTPTSKTYTFEPSSRILTVQDDLTDLNFIGRSR
jgi:hypothetical protein